MWGQCGRDLELMCLTEIKESPADPNKKDIFVNHDFTKLQNLVNRYSIFKSF